ncbi:MAG TPA: transketolase, partial [Paracoccus sp.]|nr:transketolase [Paracoccus sp. (in: a-proteobacteria)]
GPLGQGIANDVGMALAELIIAARFGDDIVNHRTWVIAGDGDLMEGVSHEASSLAGHLGLAKLIVLFDDNHISIDGATALSVSDDQLTRFTAYGWDVFAVDGHNADAVATAIEAAIATDRPSLIACRTTIGYGAPTKAGTAATHGAALGEDEVAGARKKLGWPHPPFQVPNAVATAWREAGGRGAAPRAAWTDRLAALDADTRAEFERAINGRLPDGWRQAIAEHKRELFELKPARATRESSGAVLEALTKSVPEMIGGSADLTGSVNTRSKTFTAVEADDFSGRYINWGVREHGMAAAMNGIWLHGGFRPYGGTFLTFTDYARGAIRLSALMGLPVIYVMTHDSIGLGEDGPTHQPVEHLAIARATPNILTLRPCDQVETAEAWELALTQTARPTIMALSRQGLQALRTSHQDENLSARGAYVLREASGGKPAVVLMASGSEVEIAATARDTLEAEGTPARVVSVPSMELFRDQPSAYREEVLPAGTVRVAIEAAVRQPWDWLLLGERGREEKSDFVGMTGFGASGPAPALYKEFGITADNVVARVKAML